MSHRNYLFLNISALILAATAMTPGSTTLAQSDSSASPEVMAIAQCTLEKDTARHANVRDYAIDLSMMGHEITQFYEQTRVIGPDGEAYATYRLVPPSEIGKRTSDTSQMLTPEALNVYADSVEQLGEEMEREMTQSGLPVDMVLGNGPAETEEPWASPNPRVMTGAMAKFARGASEADSHISDGRAEAAADINDMSAFFNQAEKVGTAEIEGTQADHLRAENLNIVRSTNGQEFIIKNVDLWVDNKECVPLKMRIEGTANVDGQSREMFIEKLTTDYRLVPNSNMYESYRQVMRMGGVLSPKEMAEMESAREQLAEFDKQMASMPPSQQAMMKNMMGSQIDMMRKMIDTGAIEFESVVRNIRVNPGVEGAFAH